LSQAADRASAPVAANVCNEITPDFGDGLTDQAAG
jgi:hypothetical protein